MKFQTNTKPFADALALGIINSNVSNFHKKSCIVQISATEDTLRINIEAAMLCTEIKLKGHGEGEPTTIFVDSLLLKQFASTLDTSTITLDFEEGGLTIVSGKSRFTLPKSLDVTEIELASPSFTEDQLHAIEFNKESWKFVKDFQMYAISMAFVHPVYTRVWLGVDGDVLVGDYDTGLFTHSIQHLLGDTCLLKDSIISLFTSLPEDAKVFKLNRDYIIQINTDSFSYVTQFKPEYEDDESVGSYESPIFLGVMQHPDKMSTIDVALLTKLFSQALLLSTSSEDTIQWIVKDKSLRLLDRNVDGNIAIDGDTTLDYTLNFRLEKIKQVISNYTDEKINVAPVVGEDGETISGILVWDNNLTTLLAGVN